MKKIRLLIIILLMIPMTSTAAEVFLNESKVKAFSQSFFDMLAQGDTNALQYLLDDELLDMRKKLLANPNYGDFLRTYYKNSEFNIVSIDRSGGNGFEVIFEIRQGGETQSVHTLCFSSEKGLKFSLSKKGGRNINKK